MTTRIVLVPGFWLGAWAWDDVVPILAERGFDVVALDLPGAALTDRASAIEHALETDADRRVLVVHSGAAFPGTLVMDRRPDLVDRCVFVDTSPVIDGLAFNPEQHGDLTLADAWSGLVEEGSTRDLTDVQVQTFRDRATPESRAIVTEAVRLTNDERLQVPITVICTAFSASAYQEAADQGVPYFAALPAYDDVTYIDLPTGHWPMWSRPEELAELIANEAARTT